MKGDPACAYVSCLRGRVLFNYLGNEHPSVGVYEEGWGVQPPGTLLEGFPLWVATVLN